MDKYFGFLESKEISNNTIKLMFDCVATIDFRPFSSLREISELRTLTISIEIPRHSKKHKEIQLLKQNRWHEIFLSTEIGNLFCSMIDISGGTINNESRIYKINTLKKRSKKNIELEKTFSLNRFTPSNKNSIKDVIDKIENHSFIINVMNVGQGNSIAAKDFYSSKELFYVDVGRGINQNYDININPAFHPSDEAFVILTHWDKDHWASSEVENRLKKIKWIVPQQEPIGVSHMKLASDLHHNGNLLLWPDNIKSIGNNILDIYKLPKNSDRNLSGLVTVCKNEHWNLAPCEMESNHSKNLLITGDAPYKKCGFLNNYTLDALVIPHHGGSFKCERHPKVKRGNCAVLSCGKINSYGHPHQSTISAHIANGWHVDTTFTGDLYIKKKKYCVGDACASYCCDELLFSMLVASRKVIYI